jgi:hypothetical protein
VTFSPRARVLVGATLAATLALKALSGGAPAEPGPTSFSVPADAWLRAAGFSIRHFDHPIGVFVFGERQGCRVMLTDYAPGGEHRDLIGIFARPVGPLAYAWRGRLHDTPPHLWPVTERLIQRQLRRFGAVPVRHPIVAVAASPTCDLARFDWAALAALPG